MKRFITNMLYSITVIIIVLIIWYIASICIDVELILPTPYVAFSNVGSYLASKEFWVSFGWTYLRCIEGFILSFCIAMIFAILAYMSNTLERLLNPFMGIIRAVPTMAVLLILIIILRPNQTPIVVAGIVICPILYQSFLASLKGIDPNLIEMVEVYKVPKSKQIFQFYMPSVLPAVFSHSVSGFSLTIKLIIAAEALAQTANSIGKMMQFAKVNIEIEKLFALTIIAIAISLISEAIVRLVQRLVCVDDRT